MRCLQIEIHLAEHVLIVLLALVRDEVRCVLDLIAAALQKTADHARAATRPHGRAENNELIIRERTRALRARNGARALVHRIEAAAKIPHRAAAVDLVADLQAFAAQCLSDFLHGFFRVSRAGIVKA